MRKATLVLATSVAFLLFAVPNSYAGIKKKVQLPTAQSVANGSGVPVKSGNTLSIPGELQQEYIPADNFSRSTPIKVLPTIDYSIPRTINQVKGLLRANAASIAVGGVISGLVVGLDWVMGEGGQIQKPDGPPTVLGFASNTSSSFTGSCNGIDSYSPGFHSSGPGNYQYVISDPAYTANGFAYVNNCGPGYRVSQRPYTPVVETPASLEPVTPEDLDLVDAYVNAQNSDWLRDLLRESCDGSSSPQRCYEDLKDNVSLSGPSTVNGPSSFVVTSGPNGTTTKETKTTFQITYGSDYFVYAPTTTTTTVNPDGTTEVETEEPAPEEEPTEEELDSTIGDPYAPVVDKYNDIAGGVGDLEGNMSFINYGPWYSFGGACSPITLNLPVMGTYTIDHCPYVIDWIRPTLGFLFAVWTWLHCFSLWRETVQNARPI